MTLEEAEDLLKGTFPRGDEVKRVVREVRWRPLDSTIEEALNQGRDDEVRETIEAFNAGAYI